METLLRDLRFGARMLARNPRFSSLAVLMLALGIGANTLVFSTVDAWLVRSLPFREPNRLAAVWESEAKSPNTPSIFAPWRHYQEWKQAESFEGLAGFFGYTLTGEGETQSLLGQLVTEDYFSTLGIQATLGRTFEPDDLGGPPVVILGSGFWQRRFGAATDVIGAAITLNDRTYLLVGVAGDTKVDSYGSLARSTKAMAYVPYAQASEDNILARRGNVVVRITENHPELASVIGGEIRSLEPTVPPPELQTMAALLSRSIKQPRLQTLLSSSFAVVALLLAAIGLYGVISYTVIQRSHEIGIRVALGAQNRDVLRPVLGQGVSLTLAGIAIGLFASLALTRLIKSLLYGVSASDPLTFIVIALMLMFVAFSACYLPARRATKVDPVVALRHE